MKKIFFLLFFVLNIFPTSPIFAEDEKQGNIFYEKADVIKVEEVIEKTNNEVISKQKIKIKILSGEYKGDIKEIENELSSNPLNLKINTNDKILIYIEEFEKNEYTVQIQSFYVLRTLTFLIVLFLLTLVVIGGKQGLKAIISLVVSIGLIFKVFIPKALLGVSPLLLSLIVSSIIAIITLSLISGFKKKTLASILGTLGGVLTATIIAVLFSNYSHLTGLSDEHARTLFSVYPHLNFKGLLLAGIIIGSLGAVMDVAMSIASTISEVKKAHPNISRIELVKSGMNVGRDIMGTMSNTLIFAYVGSSLFLLLLFNQYNESYLKFLNFNFVAEEIVRSIAGSIGLIFSIPLTALIAGYLENKK